MYAYAHTPLDEELLNLQISPPETNVSLLYEAFMVSKDFRMSLQNKFHPSLKFLLNKVFLWFT